MQKQIYWIMKMYLQNSKKKSDVKATANLKDEPALSRGFCHIFAQTSLMADCRSLKKDNRLNLRSFIYPRGIGPTYELYSSSRRTAVVPLLNLHFWLPQMPFQKIILQSYFKASRSKLEISEIVI